MIRKIQEGNRVFVEIEGHIYEGIVHEKRDIYDIDGSKCTTIYKVYFIEKPDHLQNITTIWVDESCVVRSYYGKRKTLFAR